MKFAFFGFSLLVGSLAFAANIFWAEVGTLTETSENREQFIALQQKYPEQFGSYDVDAVETATIVVKTYELQGETVCPRHDARAHMQSSSTTVCLKDADPSDNIGAECMATALKEPDPVSIDPCAK